MSTGDHPIVRIALGNLTKDSEKGFSLTSKGAESVRGVLETLRGTAGFNLAVMHIARLAYVLSQASPESDAPEQLLDIAEQLAT